MKSNKNILTFPILGIAAFLMAAMLFSCKNDIETIRSLDVVDTLPDMSARNVEILYSERGHVQIKLTAPSLVRKTMDDEPVIEFPEGFHVIFYDSAFQVKSTISGDYGISYEKKRMMEARYNVIVENLQTNQKLNTEQLFWDQNKETIYTDKFVKMTRGDEIILSDGLKADQSFENIEFYHVNGVIEVKEDEE